MLPKVIGNNSERNKSGKNWYVEAGVKLFHKFLHFWKF